MPTPIPRFRHDSRWPFVVAFFTGFVLIALQQVYFGLLDARHDATNEATAILGFLQSGDRPVSAESLARVASRFEDVVAAEFCDEGTCPYSYQRDGETATPCGEDVAVGFICTESVGAPAAPRVIVRYAVRSSLATNARDLLFFAAFGVIAFMTWAAASRRYRGQLEDAQGLLQHSTTHDALTGLQNRTAFEAELEEALRAPEPSYLLFLDLDGFKDINDSFGHTTGDDVIREVAKRFSAAVGPHVIGRLGGDEFGVLVCDIRRGTGAEDVAGRLLASLRQPIKVNGVTTPVGVSIGVARLDGTVREVGEALRRADVAMYEVKRQRRGQARHFDAELDRQMRARYALERDLVAAVDADALHLEYQPQVDAQGHLRGVEALARWNHPTRGRVPPIEFIPLAENSNLIVRLGWLIVRRACADLCEARRLGLALPYVSVNLSPRQLAEPDFCEALVSELRRHALGPRDMELEVTESALMGDDGMAAMERLAALGFRIAIDDFGTGYSSLSRLQTMPVSKLKIDRSFVQPLGAEPGASVVVETIMVLAKRLKLSTVAEGVENAEQLAWLHGAGCALMQGYFFSRPLPLRQLVAWAAERQPSERPALAWGDTGLDGMS